MEQERRETEREKKKKIKKHYYYLAREDGERVMWTRDKGEGSTVASGASMILVGQGRGAEGRGEERREGEGGE